MLKPILPNVWHWAWFSEEKGLDFNGHLLTVGEHRVVVDPPPMSLETKAHLRRIGTVDYIVITNRDHLREAATYQREWGCHLYAPEKDAPELPLTPTRTYKDGELLPGGIWAIQFTGQKSPGESGLYLQQSKGILILGDALIGKPPGELSMLPAEKYADVALAKSSLQRILKYDFRTLLVGDGTSLFEGAKDVVARCLA
ncbi:MAG: hypothetical protein U0172_05175 [Nitrospiraceae bacterium]